MQLRNMPAIPVAHRHKAFLLLVESHGSWEVARDIEANAHAISSSLPLYIDKIQQVVFNLQNNKRLREAGASIVLMSDSAMSRGTLIEDIENESAQRRLRFEQIVQEKYDMVNREACRGTLKCSRCGSTDIAWEQKQTRGADEAMTVFCTCSKCSRRWTMR